MQGKTACRAVHAHTSHRRAHIADDVLCVHDGSALSSVVAASTAARCCQRWCQRMGTVVT